MRPIMTMPSAITGALFALAMLGSADAQQAPRDPAAGQQPPATAQLAPPKPYKPVMVTLPKVNRDANLDSLRKEIVDIARRKDRAALANRVTARDFIWERVDGKPVDDKQPGIDQLADALDLADPDGAGWEALAAIASDPNVAPVPGMASYACAPAPPQFDEAQLDQLAQTTQTDPVEWVYPIASGVEVRARAAEDAPVIERLGLHFVLTSESDSEDDAASNAAEWLHIVTPSGKTGYVRGNTVRWLETDQICYVKQGNTWKIGGYVGGGG